MSLKQIDNETWDIAGPEADKRHLPSDSKPEVAVPTKWRALGLSALLTRHLYLSLCLLVLWPLVAYAQEMPYQLYVVRPAITDWAILPDGPLPRVCYAETTMQIMCARGEYEPASFVVDTEQTLEHVMVTVGQLKGPAGILPLDAVDVRIAQMLVRAVRWDPIVMPWLLVHDPTMVEVVDGPPAWVKSDAAIGDPPVGLENYRAAYSQRHNHLTRELVDTDKLQPADITGRRQFWLTIHIPDDAQAGIYVPSFDLREPQFEYSLYYPVYPYDGSVTRYTTVTDEQQLADYRNMVAHGCTNPVIYAGAEVNNDGSLHFTTLAHYLDIREQAGMEPGGPLYIFPGGNDIVARDLTKEEWERNVETTREIVSWCQARGYDEVYFMGHDEAKAEKMAAERDSFASIHEGGGKIWVACGQDFFDRVGDLLDCPVLSHPGRAADHQTSWTMDSTEFLRNEEALADYGPRQLLAPHIQEFIKGVHHNGFKIFTYADPPGGHAQPDMHRRNRGLGLWKTGVDGTMTWTYSTFVDRGAGAPDRRPKPNDPDGMNVGGLAFVVRGPEGPVDTLGWEAYREGYDDARYLATLQDAIAKAGERGRQAQQWLDSIAVDADLDAWRWEMARQIELLQ